MNSDDIQSIFFVECEEALEAAEAGLTACREGTHDDETINAVFRAVHSIKGGAGAFGYMPMQGFTHEFESLLSDVRDGTVSIEPELVDLLLISLDTLRYHVDAAQNGTDSPSDEAVIAQIVAAQASSKAAAEPAEGAPAADAPADDGLDLDFDLDALLDDLSASDEPAPSEGGAATDADVETYKVFVRPHSGAMSNGSEPLLWLRELKLLGAVSISCDIGDMPSIDECDPRQGYLGWVCEMPKSVSEDAVREIFDFVGDDCSVALGEDAAMPPAKLSQAKLVSAEPIARKESAEPEAGQAPASPPVPAASPAPAPAEAVKSTADVPADEQAKTPASSAPAASNSANANASIRIELGKLDRLIDGAGELVIAQAMLAQRLAGSGLGGIDELVAVEGLVREIQERAMAFRAQPIATVFNRVPRLLRELAGSTGKHVKLLIEGEATELDKTVIERLSEPLTHLIRNAVDHGIEGPEERVAAGKSHEGVLTLSAEQRAGRIVIRIGDDGRGINRERVLAKAVEKGVIDAHASLSDEEICNLIFAPGFSTAQQVSSISGRGVGMDVVRQNVKDLGGRITIESEEGKGTTFVLALPLTLAIADGMVVVSDNQTLVIPLTHVVESLRPVAEDIKKVGMSRQMLNVRGRYIPIVSLAKVLNHGAPSCDPCNGVLVIVETETSNQAALLVDNIIDQRQMVIKSLATHYRSIEGLAGATILGDGRVALITDVDKLVENSVSAVQQAEAA
ncbi:chemotaxis protein CheA [Qipengyuania sp.]|uniref:chemotaxis protein CheA n=1 Tax=Qipengyuania sp. TaxID=2004515 RepID=UPI0035C7C60E